MSSGAEVVAYIIQDEHSFAQWIRRFAEDGTCPYEFTDELKAKLFARFQQISCIYAVLQGKHNYHIGLTTTEAHICITGSDDLPDPLVWPGPDFDLTFRRVSTCVTQSATPLTYPKIWASLCQRFLSTNIGWTDFFNVIHELSDLNLSDFEELAQSLQLCQKQTFYLKFTVNEVVELFLKPLWRTRLCLDFNMMTTCEIIGALMILIHRSKPSIEETLAKQTGLPSVRIVGYGDKPFYFQIEAPVREFPTEIAINFPSLCNGKVICTFQHAETAKLCPPHVKFVRNYFTTDSVIGILTQLMPDTLSCGSIGPLASQGCSTEQQPTARLCESTFISCCAHDKKQPVAGI
jgi:hypothetical protein